MRLTSSSPSESSSSSSEATAGETTMENRTRNPKTKGMSLILFEALDTDVGSPNKDTKYVPFCTKALLLMQQIEEEAGKKTGSRI